MSRSVPTLNDLEALTDVLVRQIHAVFRTTVPIDRKPDQSLVTEVDRLANQTAQDWARGFSDLGFVGEEGSDVDLAGKDHVLYIDPLDGTSTFVAGKSEISIVVTLMKRIGARFKPELCVIAEPITGWRWYAARNSGVFGQRAESPVPRRIEPLHASTSPPFHVSVITWRNVPYRLGKVRNTIEKHTHLHHHGCGNTGINGPLIACGHMHGVVYAGKHATESAAISLMISEAGGIATDLFGAPLDSFELIEDESGRADFALPAGLIATSSQAVNDLLVSIVKSHQ